MRRLFLLFLVVLLACPFLAGCNVRGKINEKITEKILEESLGSNIDFAIDGEGITLKGKEGESITIGSTKWPEVDFLPAFKKGRIVSTTNDGKGNVVIIMENVDRKDFEDYLKNIKKNFAQETSESQTDNLLSFSGKNSGGITVVLQYFINDKTFSIISAKDTE